MFRKFIARALALAFVCTIAASSSAFAVASSNLPVEQYTVTTEDGIQKQVNIINQDIKLISWENERYMIFEQYDSQDVLIDQVIVDKISVQATSSFDERNGNSEFALEKPELSESSFEPRINGVYIDTVKAINPITVPVTEKKMLIFENSPTTTVAYNVPSTARTIAQLASQVAVGLLCSAAIAGKVVSVFISVGICWVTGNTIDRILSVTVLAEKTTLSYYGKDFVTSQASSPYQSGARFKISDRDSRYFNNEYSEGFLYEYAKSTIADALCKNLYGANFRYVNSI